MFAQRPEEVTTTHSLQCRPATLIAFLCLTQAGLLGQPTISTYDGTTPGVAAPGSPAGAYALSGFDTVNMGNMHLNFTLPLLDIP